MVNFLLWSKWEGKTSDRGNECICTFLAIPRDSIPYQRPMPEKQLPFRIHPRLLRGGKTIFMYMEMVFPPGNRDRDGASFFLIGNETSRNCSGINRFLSLSQDHKAKSLSLNREGSVKGGSGIGGSGIGGSGSGSRSPSTGFLPTRRGSLFGSTGKALQLFLLLLQPLMVL